jgi:putative tryptophan/tyrosine transport system substrate-binding protein
MRRREVIALVGHATAAPFLGSGSLHAQMPERMRHIGVLKYTGESDRTSKAGAQAFEEELARLGWRKGAAVRIDYRFGDGDAGRTAALAKELVALAPDAIVSRGTPATHALLHETRTVPIVFVSVSDPVGDRFVNSIARPGGNITGFTNLEAGVAGKWLELLKEVAPNTRRVAALFNPDVATAGGTFYLRAIAEAASSFGVSVEAIEVRTVGEIERGLEALARTPDGGLIGMPDPFVVAHRALTMDLVAGHRLPAVYGFRNMAVEGGLMSYGVDLIDLDRRSADYVNRILKGTRPGELPVQAPTKFELVINLKTASALGLAIPPTLLARADEVIE